MTAIAIVFPGQGQVSTFLYKLDRGANFRNIAQIKAILNRIPGLELIDVVQFQTFPGWYLHATFILEIKD